MAENTGTAGQETMTAQHVRDAKAVAERNEGVADKMTETKILLTAREVAALTGFNEGTLRHWVSQKRIPFVRISNRCVRFRREDIARWVTERSVAARDHGRS
jgi:excisionase family DNA binding protein